MNILDLPCRPGFNISMDGGGDCLHGGHYADDLARGQYILDADQQTKVSNFLKEQNV